MLHAQKEVERVQNDIVRLERFVERFRYKKNKAKQAQAKLTQIGRLEQERAAAAAEVALLSRKTRGLGFEFLKPARSGRTVVEADGLDVSRRRTGRCCATRRSRSSAASTSRSSGRTAPARRRCSSGSSRGRGRSASGTASRSAYFSQQEMELDARGSVLQCVQSMTGLLAAGRAEPARPLPLLRLGRAREGGLGALGRRAAAARARRDGRVRRELPRPRRADEPPRPREPRGARGGARRVPGDGAARLARPRAARRDRRADARDRGRRAAGLRRRLGRARCARARSGRPARSPSRRSSAPKPAPKPKRAQPQAAALVRSSSSSRAEIAAREAEVAELEKKLAEDWTDVDVLAAHKRSRDALTALLERWEQLFEQRPDASHRSLGDRTARAGKRGFRPASCCLVCRLPGRRPLWCARARRRPARARCGLRLSPASPCLCLRPLALLCI